MKRISRLAACDIFRRPWWSVGFCNQGHVEREDLERAAFEI